MSGTQNLPLRGHEDDSTIVESPTPSNDGNFKAMLRFRVDAGDKVLQNHLDTAFSWGMYLRKTIQNEIKNYCTLEAVSYTHLLTHIKNEITTNEK